MHPRVLLRELSAHDIAEWEAYLSIEPRGEDRDDWRTAALAASIANSNPYRKRGSRALEAKDFLLRFKPPPQSVSQEERAAEVRQKFDALFHDDAD